MRFWLMLQPTTRGEMRGFGFSFQELLCCHDHFGLCYPASPSLSLFMVLMDYCSEAAVSLPLGFRLLLP